MSIRYYEENAAEFFRRSVDADVLPARAQFAGLIPPGGKVLEAGCGAGRDARAFKALGFQVTAIEAAPKLAALARAHSGLPVEVMTFDQITWREAFDGIWACASLLHVARQDLPDTLRRLRAALVPGGVWFMSFKYGTEERLANGRRFTDLDEAGAEALLTAAGGLELIALEVTGDVRPDRVQERWLSVLCRRVG
jgi:cyclopropane fatty-acyl-phospholipid synthase-like methyltransferase